MINIKFKDLTISGFRSFTKPQIFKLDREPGLYFIFGENQVTPTLGSNAAGKSTTFDALSWALLGETSRGLKSKDIKNRNSDIATKVQTNFDVNNENKQLVKTYNPNAIKLTEFGKQERVIEQKELSKLVSAEDFLNSVLIAQFNESFLDLKPAARLTTFSSIMDLDMWEKCSEKAKAKRQAKEIVLSNCNGQKTQLTSQINSLQEQVTSLHKQLDAYEVERQIQLQNYSNQKNKLVEQLSSLEADKQLAESIYKDHQTQLNDKKINRDDYLKQITKLIENIHSTEQNIAVLKTNLESLNKQVHNYETEHSNKLKELESQKQNLLENIKQLETTEIKSYTSNQNLQLNLNNTKIQQDLKLAALKNIDTNINNLKQSLVAVNTNIASTKLNLDKWKSLIDKCPWCESLVNPSFVSKQKIEITRQLILLNKEKHSVEEQIEKHTQSKQELDNVILDIKSQLENISKTIRIQEQEYNATKQTRLNNLQQVENINAAINKENSINSTSIKNNLVNEITESETLLNGHNENYTKLTEQKTKLETDYSEITESIKELETNLITSTNKYNELKQAVLSSQQQLKTISDNIDTITKNVNPYIELHNITNNDLITKNSNLVTLQASIDQTNKDCNGFEYWEKGFKELRLWIISDALNLFEIESNNALAKLGMPNYTLKYQMERETTIGTISKAFHVFVNTPQLPPNTLVPFEAWCGGETKRLKLATTIGLAELIANYRGFRTNIEIWDEPTNHLSKEGIDDLIKCLAERAIEKQKAIYYIDQRDLESSYFTEVIKVVNTIENGSIIQ